MPAEEAMNRRELLAGGVNMMAAAALSSRAGAADPGAALIMRKIPSSAEELPIIGLGTSRTFEVGESAAERAPGELLMPDMHQRAFLATKVWTRGERSGIEQMTHSAQMLKSARLDLIQVHNLLDLDTHLKTLRKWKQAGRVRYIGVTHYTVSAHADLARVLAREKLDFVQFNYSPLTRDAEARLLPLAAERGVAVLVNRPFEDGALFQAVRGKPLPGWAADLDAASWGQLALKFIAAHPAVTCIIPATGKAAHLKDNLAGGRGRLPDERQRAAIAQAFV